MTRFDKFTTSSIDSLAEWINEYGAHDASPWITWFDNKYCSICPYVVIDKKDSLEKLGFELMWEDRTTCSHCEVYKKCRYFPDMKESPSNTEIIKMWLESEVEE